MVSEALTCSGVVGASRRVMAESSQFGEGGVVAEGGWGALGCGGGRGAAVAVVGDALGWRISFLVFCLWALRLFFLLSSLSTGRG